MKDSPRKEILNKIARAIGKIELAHPVRVGIDGLSASGKTVFADDLPGFAREGKESFGRDWTVFPPARN